MISSASGALLQYDELERGRVLTRDGLLCYVVISARVIVYDSKPDPAFTLSIDGVRAFYNDGDLLRFSITANAPAWLNVLVVEESVSLLYPNYYEPQVVLEPGVAYRFPMERLEYLLSTDGKPVRPHRLFFVITKNKVAYTGANDEGSFWSWYNAMQPDEKNLYVHSFTVQQ
jgi:hypothetical protein